MEKQIEIRAVLTRMTTADAQDIVTKPLYCAHCDLSISGTQGYKTESDEYLCDHCVGAFVSWLCATRKEIKENGMG
jgi:hypothetical protein